MVHTALRILNRWKQAGHKTSRTFKRLSKSKPIKPKSSYIIDIDWRKELDDMRIEYLNRR